MSGSRVLGVVFLLLCGCSSSSDGGTGGASGGGGASGAGGSSAVGGGGAAGSGHGGATGSGGEGQDLYGDIGAPGTATLSCNGATCSAHQVCCELLGGSQAQCVDSYEACADLATSTDPSPPAYGCVSATQCSGEVCCGARAGGIAVKRYIATSCRAACPATEDPVCGFDSDCTAPEMCVMSAGLGTCF